MRSLNPDAEYFAFLDELRDSGTVNTVLAASYLVREFPGLRAEEAKAICADWRATYHERRARPTAS
ncbi:MAG: hypothetical protein IKE20_07250 [Eggerthellaceae bacterium]|nr:hypothetical protein [Eggerthellaceae bacterium]